MIMRTPLRTTDVFGISVEILEHSYVDRGALDAEIQQYLRRDTHIALRGESKCGKSWLRKKNIPDAIVIQCRLNKTIDDIYVDALSQLGIVLRIEVSSKKGFRGTVEATQDFGNTLLARIGLKQSVSKDTEDASKSKPVGHDVNDLRFVAELIRASGRRLVIEDFHYLAAAERKAFAHDLKALWDYKCFVVLIGIWAENNLLISLNSDLSGRVHESSIFWNEEDLKAVIEKGSSVLKVAFSEGMKRTLVENSFETVGILQSLLIGTLDHAKITHEQNPEVNINDPDLVTTAALEYAEQLNAVYQTFARRVARGIRTRSKATGIYAHLMAVALEAGEGELMRGLHLDYIFEKAHERQPRIQKGILRLALQRIDGLQVDSDGRGLILSYDPQREEVFVTDKQLLLYRRFSTLKWPWDEIIAAADASGDGFGTDDGDEDNVQMKC